MYVRTICLLFFVACCYAYHERVLLSDVKAITLNKNRKTTGRRSSPVPQLKCVGGSAGCNAFTPETVQCINQGSDGFDAQWDCKADMDDKYRFGKVEVTCEGYDFPNDPYILKGSCGLEYTIDNTEKGREYSNDRPSYYHKEKSSDTMSWIIFFIIVGGAVYLIKNLASNSPDNSSNNQQRTPPPYPNQGTNYGQNDNQSPPPYGFKNEYTSRNTQSPPPYHDSTYTRSQQQQQSPFGGFWSGMGLGGLGGYLFGSRRNHYGSAYARPSYGWGGNGGWGSGNCWASGNRYGSSSWGSGSSTTHRSSSGSSSRTASGFGGTSRR